MVSGGREGREGEVEREKDGGREGGRGRGRERWRERGREGGKEEEKFSRPSCILQAIKNWRRERPGSEAKNHSLMSALSCIPVAYAFMCQDFYMNRPIYFVFTLLFALLSLHLFLSPHFPFILSPFIPSSLSLSFLPLFVLTLFFLPFLLSPHHSALFSLPLYLFSLHSSPPLLPPSPSLPFPHQKEDLPPDCLSMLLQVSEKVNLLSTIKEAVRAARKREWFMVM